MKAIMLVCGKSQENAHLTTSTLTQVWLTKCESKLAKEILVRVFMLLKKKGNINTFLQPEM